MISDRKDDHVTRSKPLKDFDDVIPRIQEFINKREERMLFDEEKIEGLKDTIFHFGQNLQNLKIEWMLKVAQKKREKLQEKKEVLIPGYIKLELQNRWVERCEL